MASTSTGPEAGAPAARLNDERGQERQRELLRELRFCGGTLLRALTAAARRCETGHLRLLFEQLALRVAVRHAVFVERLSHQDLPATPAGLVTLEQLAARGCLPDGDDAIVARCGQLVHDLQVRCEDVLERGVPARLTGVLRAYADLARELRATLAEHERRE